MLESNKKRLLLLSCSKAKVETVGLLPAIERYNGVMFRVLRRYLRQKLENQTNLEILILSAEFGLITIEKKIPLYDHYMTTKRANQLRPVVATFLKEFLSENIYDSILICLGKKYHSTLEDSKLDKFSPLLLRTTGSTGFQLQQLKSWLYEEDFQYEKKDLSHTNKILRGGPKTEKRSRGYAVLKGRRIILSTQEVFDIAQTAIDAGEYQFVNFRKWSVLVGSKKVGVKWLAGKISGLPVSKFTSREARQFLLQLGIESYQSEI
jgi:hypothetical protein